VENVYKFKGKVCKGSKNKYFQASIKAKDDV